jgi:hypothetical protein
MSFLNSFQLMELASFAALSDREVRSDLSKGFIKDENDYTSNFTSAFRRHINSYSQSGLSATSFLLQPCLERAAGVDAAIILSCGNQSKVAVFEAKWPRFLTSNYAWDYAQSGTGLSHFSDQLKRQKRVHKSFAIFEMFYSEHSFGAQPRFLDPNGSSCVWHDDTDAFCNQRPNPDDVWSQAELQTLLTAKRISIAEVMREFGVCNKGNPIQMVDPNQIGREFHLPQCLLAISAKKKVS